MFLFYSLTLKTAQAHCVAFSVAYFVSIYWEDSAVTFPPCLLECQSMAANHVHNFTITGPQKMRILITFGFVDNVGNILEYCTSQPISCQNRKVICT